MMHRLCPRKFDLRMNFKTVLLHQATFCRRDLFSKVGGFDASLKIAMDYDFFLRAYRMNASVSRYRAVVSVMRNTGISSRRDAVSLIQRFREERFIQIRHCNNLLLAMVYKLYWPLYLCYRGIWDFWHPLVLFAALKDK